MTNSSPTIRERIIRNAMQQAYMCARQLGYDPVQATGEAFMVADFINLTVGFRGGMTAREEFERLQRYRHGME